MHTPVSQAHGGYSYCGLAALCIAGRADALDLHSLSERMIQSI